MGLDLESAFMWRSGSLCYVGDFEDSAARCRRGAMAAGSKKPSSHSGLNPLAVRVRGTLYPLGRPHHQVLMREFIEIVWTDTSGTGYQRFVRDEDEEFFAKVRHKAA
jgi:hypothetical protein